MPQREQSKIKAMSAASSVAGILPQLAGVAAGIAVLSIFAGWKEASAYYSNFGAPWFVSNLSPAMLMERVAPSMLTLAIFSILSISNIGQGAASAKGLRRWSLAAVILGTVLFLVEFLPASTISNNAVFICTQLGAVAFSVSAGLTVGEVVARLADIRTSQLPAVLLKSSPLEKSWRVVAVVGSQFLLVTLSEKPELRTFKVVDGAEILVISSVKIAK